MAQNLDCGQETTSFLRCLALTDFRATVALTRAAQTSWAGSFVIVQWS